MTQVTIAEAKSRLEELLDKASQGEVVEILGAGGASQGWRIVPASPEESGKTQKRPLRRSEGLGLFGPVSDDFFEPLEDFKEYME
jgi:antitoxin (DNA-binding transcriptional repressor) of toxin-antitoxin stability system